MNPKTAAMRHRLGLAGLRGRLVGGAPGRHTVDDLVRRLGRALGPAERAPLESLGPLDELVEAMDGTLERFPAFRQADVRWHIGLAETTGSPRLVAAMTDAQGQMSDVISYIAHPPELLAWTNQQHARMLAAVRRRDGERAMRIMLEHLKGTEHVLAGLLPAVH